MCPETITDAPINLLLWMHIRCHSLCLSYYSWKACLRQMILEDFILNIACETFVMVECAVKYIYGTQVQHTCFLQIKINASLRRQKAFMLLQSKHLCKWRHFPFTFFRVHTVSWCNTQIISLSINVVEYCSVGSIMSHHLH